MGLRVFTDIETLPPEEDLRKQLSPTVVRKLLRKRTQKDGCEDGEGTEEEFRGLALHGEFGRVLTIGMIVEEDGQILHSGVLGRERQTMMFHLIHRIKPTVQFPFARYRNEPIYDTMMSWCSWNYGQFISLDLLAQILKVGINKTEGMDGGCVYDRFCQGCHQEIAEYCLRDVEVVRAVYYALEYLEGPVPEYATAAANGVGN